MSIRVANGLATRILSLSLVALFTVATAGQAQVKFLNPDGAALPFLSYNDVESFLATADIVWKEKISEGTNKQKRKVMLQKGGAKAHAVLRTTYEHKDSPHGGFVDSYMSELAAYHLSQLLGMDNVPPVVKRKGGSLQIWVENTTTDASRRKAGEEPAHPDSFQRQTQDMNVFDNLIANTDRNPGNILIAADGKVWFIDHTRSFAGQEELKYPDKITGCSSQLYQRLREVSDQEIKNAVGPYVKRYIPQLLIRRALLLEALSQKIAAEGADNVLFDGAARP